MTRRERVLRAIGHREPDKVPIDLGAMRSTGITAVAYNRLKKYLGIEGGETLVYDVVQQLAQPEISILDYWEADVIDLGRAFLAEEKDWKDFVLPDGSPAKIPASAGFEPDGSDGWVVRSDDGTVIGVMPKAAFFLDQSHYPLLDWDGQDLSALEKLPTLMGKVTWAALATAPWHVPPTREHLAEISRRAKNLYETTDFAILAAFGGNLLEWGQFLRRNDQFLLDLVDNPRAAEALLDRLTEIHIENLEKFLNAIEGYVQIIQMGDDLGTQLAPQISPEMYRRFFKPRHKLIYERVKRRRGIHLFLHSCGSIAALLPDLIDAGVEIINPVQTSARGMEPEKLKNEFGKDLTFWGGGCDTQRVLPQGSAGEIDAHVRRRMEIFGPGGGFVFTQVHNIMPNVPPQNMVAMAEAAKTYRALKW
ncbi:MAG: uroporphyrinogen decarboxylase family protein [Acidobacteriota bacterium]